MRDDFTKDYLSRVSRYGRGRNTPSWGRRWGMEMKYKNNPPVRPAKPAAPLTPTANRTPVSKPATIWQGQKLAPGTFDGWLSSSNGVVTQYPTMQAAIAAGGDYYEPNFRMQPQYQPNRTPVVDPTILALMAQAQQRR